MSSFDFGITVAIGSILASTILTSSVSIIDGAVGLTALYLLNGRRDLPAVQTCSKNG
jgi:uncharacterized membrane protein YcaP (DUF421 family)